MDALFQVARPAACVPRTAAPPRRLLAWAIAGCAAALLLAGCGDGLPTDPTGPSPEAPQFAPEIVAAATGSIRVITATSGVDLDANGYAFLIDNAGRTGIDLNDTVVVAGVATGSHSVKLTNVPGNCTISGGNTRTITVSSGVTTTVKFTLTCVTNTSPTGNIEIVTSTTGSNLDPDGYNYSVDSAAVRPIGINATAMVIGMRVGTSRVDLRDVAPNCTVTGGNAVTVAVTANTTVRASFSIVCSGGSGSIQVTTATTGSSLDPDGYTLSVDGGAGQPVGINTTLTLSNLSAGNHSLLLGGVAANCSVGEQNPRTVNVPDGGTASTTFSVSCTASSGTLLVTTATNGANLDPNGYRVSVDGGTPQAIGLNGSLSVGGLAAGNHSVQLSDLAGNCSVGGPNPQTVSISGGSTTTSAWAIDCTLALRNQIVFLSTRDASTFEIYLMNADGSNVKRLTNDSFSDEDTAVSPDGSRILFSSDRTGNREIFVMNADGSNVVNLTNHPASDTDPEWSPDGTQIAFESSRSGNEDVFVMNANGTGAVNVTNAAGDDGDVDWSPDGAKLVFEAHRDGNSEVYVMNVDGSNQVNLTHSSSTDADPAWSPDGTRIAFGSTRDGDYEIWVMNANGSSPTRLTNNTTTDHSPTWSPDGARIAFHSNRTGNYDIFVMNANGTGQTNLTARAGTDRYPEWSREQGPALFASIGP